MSALAELLSDAKAMREGFAARSPNDAFDSRGELADNVMPLLEALIEAITADNKARDEEIDGIGEMVDQLVDNAEVLQPETTTKIVAVLEVGKLLATELEALLPHASDVAKKRIQKQILAYRKGVDLEVLPHLAEITLDDDDEEDQPMPIGDPVEVGDVDDEEDEGDEDEDEDESVGG